MSSLGKSAIYLAGGFRSGWQARARVVLEGYEVLDPSTHGLKDPKEYTEWDLAAIRRCDIVLAYMEKDNPGGYALALELGYARSLGRKIVLVEEHPNNRRHQSFNMVREVADHLFDDLNLALEFLSTEDIFDIPNKVVNR